MIVTHLKLKNWRNFLEIDVPLRDRTYLLGANAMGKSNLLDVFRFLRDVAKPQGGGLQEAIKTRDGIPKLRCLHARKPEVRIEVHLAEDADASVPTWKYILGFAPEGKGPQRPIVTAEEVWRGGEQIRERPNEDDKNDPEQCTQSHLEQIRSNGEFRELAEFFGRTSYLHLVPQLLKFGDRIGGHRLEDDPFGQGFLERIAKTPPKTREIRLKKIEDALVLAVPNFKNLKFAQDEVTGRPHLEAMYSHFRPNAGWQREDQFSDGTLRLLALLWTLLDGDSLLLLEEPELSLNDSIVQQIPLLLDRIQKNRKRKPRQVLISTHSSALLSNKGIDGRSILLLEPAKEGSKIRSVNTAEEASLESGLSVSEVMLPKTNPKLANQLSLW
jgi:predicted ATPase